MSNFDTKPIQLKKIGAQQSKIATMSGEFVPSGISAHDPITALSGDYEPAGVKTFSIYPNASGNIAVETVDGIEAVYAVIAGIPLIGAFTKVVFANTTVLNFVAFV